MVRHLLRKGSFALLLLGLSASGWPQGLVDQALFSTIPIDEQVEADTAMEAYLAPYRAGLEAFAGEVVGYAVEPLSRSRPECGLSNLVADALLTIGKEEFGEELDFAITNFGGLRRDLPAGDITTGLLMELSPFQNYLTYLEVDGELAWQLAESVARSGGLAIAGLRVERSEAGDLLKAWIGGERLKRKGRYKLVTIDYLVSTWADLFREERIFEERVSAALVQRDAIVLHLSRLTERGVQVSDAGEGRVKTRVAR